jgi:membrane-associated phospholipid phosphatase
MLASVLSPHCVLAVASLLAVVSPALAEGPSAAQATDSRRVHALKFSWGRDASITAGAGLLWISSEALFKDDLAPAACRWCDRAPDGTNTLNGLDRWGRRNLVGGTEAARKRAHDWSNILGFAVLPGSVFGAQYLLGHTSGAPTRYFAEDATIILQSAMLAAVLNQGVKFAMGRERPFVHVLPEDQKALTEHPTDNNLSFYSGHTNLAFSLVVAAGTVSELRGYRHSTWIWAVGLPLAASVGALRMGADKHYLSDVLTGALLGSAFGVAVPLLLHGRADEVAEQSPAGAQALSMLQMRVSAGPGGFALTGTL